MPNACGGTIDCGECRPGEDYCVKTTPLHQAEVVGGIASVMSASPSYFDQSDCKSATSCKVLDLGAFRTALVQELDSQALVVIADPDIGEEIRVRGNPAAGVENYDIYTSAGYGNAGYTSTCFPAIF